MNEDQLRAIVREAIVRHLGSAPAGGAQAVGQASHGRPLSPVPVPAAFAPVPAGQGFGPPAVATWRGHPSHVRFVLVTGRDSDGPCLVEPGVGCSHCGYCQSYGH